MARLILMRHGASMWNEKNLFTGWVDIPLSKKGVAEAIEGGRRICGEPIDVIFCSTLIRSLMTAMLAMNEHESGKVPVIRHPGEGRAETWGKIWGEKVQLETIPTYCAWELNERMYGELQGMDKDAMRAQFGTEQVHIWRRSYAVAPPGGESLAMTAERTLPYFEKEIVPCLAQGKNVFICAHGNSLRSILMKLNNLSPEAVVALELATGKPLLYDYHEGTYHAATDLSR